MTHRLLVIDDNVNYRVLVRYALEGTDVEVVGEASNAEDGIAEAKRLAPDLILLDIVMDRMDGLAALTPLRLAAPDATVVTVSAYADHDFWGRSSQLLDVAYISKGLPPAELAGALVRARTTAASSSSDTEALERCRFPSDLQSPRNARRFVSGTLRSWNCDDDLVDSALLLVSEMVTNAVIHAHSEIELVIVLRREVVRVEVIDAGDEIVHRRRAGSDAQSGRGMAMVEALSSSWGIDSHLAGKSVWFEISRSGGDAR